MDSMALCSVQLNLEKAFADFFRNPGHFGFPHYRGKRRDRPSYTTNLIGTDIAIRDAGHLKLPKLGQVRIVRHREIPAGWNLKSVTVSRSPEGQYFASVLFEFPEPDVPEISAEPGKVRGLDFSMPELYADLDGNRAGSPKAYRKAQKRLAREQRRLSLCKKGSNLKSLSVVQIHF
ncbi:MAG: hypothetical protein LBG06_07530 [Deltaproteobacteria bacterium]|nr:hypothetical protein [Deltaproteobacteria bacterium]